jgi:tryptophanyl-tRNA synthetase
MKDIVFSGVQPTSQLHIGNYIGALSQWVELQNKHRCIFSIVDLHAITVAQEPEELRRNILEVAATYLAIGINPTKNILYIQSEVSAHAELAWILGTIAKMGELERMTQFKDKGGSKREGVGVGLFSYPVLMAADILLYDATRIPVGEDQMQHIELARVLAKRFNSRFGETFQVPEASIQKIGARVMSLQDPSKKMSKSDASALSKILLTDDAKTIEKKIMRAVTDTEGTVKYDPEKKPAVSNLMGIYRAVTGKEMTEIETEFAGKGYGDFKKSVAEAVIAHLDPIRTKIEEYLNDTAELYRILDAGRDEAKAIAEAKLKVVKERVGVGR